LVQTLPNRKQKIEIKSSNLTQSTYSNWRTIQHGIPQGSILRSSLFLIYKNDLLPTINTSSIPIIFSDDTSVIISNINIFLSQMSKWFSANKLSLNLDKTNKNYSRKLTTISIKHYI
jgi:hypothetical protein